LWTFSDCENLTLRSDMFGSDTTNRFSAVSGSTVQLQYTFELNPAFAGTQGTAPALWDFTITSVNSTACFVGHSTSSVDNFGDIPAAWK